jgi:hypothetical protein
MIDGLDVDFLAAALSSFVDDMGVAQDQFALNRDLGEVYHFTPADFGCTNDAIEEFIARLNAWDPFILTHVGERLVGEDPAAVLDRAVQARQLRLREQRVPGPAAVAAVYKPAEPPEHTPVDVAQQPAGGLVQSGGDLFLRMVIAAIRQNDTRTPDELDSLQERIAGLLGTISVADRSYDRHGKRAVSRKVELYLSLGLEQASGGSCVLAERLLLRLEPSELFRQGNAMIRHLHQGTDAVLALTCVRESPHDLLTPEDLASIHEAARALPRVRWANGRYRQIQNCAQLAGLVDRVQRLLVIAQKAARQDRSPGIGMNHRSRIEY